MKTKHKFQNFLVRGYNQQAVIRARTSLEAAELFQKSQKGKLRHTIEFRKLEIAPVRVRPRPTLNLS